MKKETKAKQRKNENAVIMIDSFNVCAANMFTS
jgi:hypothetical protein